MSSLNTAVAFDQFINSLSDLSGEVAAGLMGEGESVAADTLHVQIALTVQQLQSLRGVSRESLTQLIKANPDAVPVLASCVGLGQEQLKNQLRHRLGSSGWITLARTNPELLIDTLDAGYSLVKHVEEQLAKEWTFADVLLERYRWSRKTATGAIGRGRKLENDVEAIVRTLGLSYRMRTQFGGRGGQFAPCDLAIPAEGQPLIVGAAKGFNSTGSKLTDAVREIVEMANVRLPNQFVFAFIDGIGWKSRKADLRRIYDLWEKQYIDGLYTLSHLSRFEADLTSAAVRLGLLNR